MTDHRSTLNGTWEMTQAEFAGEKAPELVVLKTEIELNGREYIVRFAGQVADRGTFTRDSTSEPKSLTLLGFEGPNAGRTIPCIYQLAGDRLRICYGLDGMMPTGFATAAGVERYLAIYRRKI